MIHVYKIGGNVINDEKNLRIFLNEFSSLPGSKILVHGGGKEATQLGKQLGHEAQMIDGRRVTDRVTLDLVTMVYAGLINKRIVSILQEFGCDAVGLTGADGNVIPAEKRSPEPVDFGFVGDLNPALLNTSFIKLLLDNGYTPVFCAICRDRKGGLLNCNADSIANALAVACSSLSPTVLTYCFEKPGVLTDIEDDNSVISSINSEIFETLKNDGKISGGMIPKISNALEAIKKGVDTVIIRDAINLNEKKGTVISGLS